MARDRKARDIDDLKNALDAERRKEEEAKAAAEKRRRRRTPGQRGAQYQGRAIRGRGANPGAGRRNSPESGGARQRPGGGAQGEDSKVIKDLLRKVTTLYQDGLITKAEYDAKRADILDRL